MVLMLLLAGRTEVHAGSPSTAGPRTLADFFHEGNEAYHQGHFTDAIAAYRRVADYGVQNADLEYNLGNAYLRAGKVGEAILHYERALMLEPRGRDIAHNLSVAEQRIEGGAAVQLVQRGLDVGEGTEAGWVAFFRLLTRDEASFLLLLLTVVAFGLLILRRRQPTGSPMRTILAWAGGIFLTMGLLVATFHVGQWYVARTVRLGVALETLPVREGPSPDAPILFKAPAGLKMRLEPSEIAGWRPLRLNDELRGYAAANQISPIDPL